MAKMKRQTERIVYPSTQAVGTYNTRVTLDNSYKRCVGYVAYENINPGTSYGISVKDDNETYQHLTNSQDYIATKDVAKHERFTDCDIPAKGNIVSVVVEIRQALTAALDLDFVFLLRNE